MSYVDSTRGSGPILYPTYQGSHSQVSCDADSLMQTLISNLHYEGENIKIEGQNYNNKVKNLSVLLANLPKIPEEKSIVIPDSTQNEETSFISKSFLVAGRIGSHIKDYFLADGLRLLGAGAVALAVVAIIRKYPETFALPTLEGNFVASKYNHSIHHKW